jgi:hypothetical protein
MINAVLNGLMTATQQSVGELTGAQRTSLEHQARAIVSSILTGLVVPVNGSTPAANLGLNALSGMLETALRQAQGLEPLDAVKILESGAWSAAAGELFNLLHSSFPSMRRGLEVPGGDPNAPTTNPKNSEPAPIDRMASEEDMPNIPSEPVSSPKDVVDYLGRPDYIKKVSIPTKRGYILAIERYRRPMETAGFAYTVYPTPQHDGNSAFAKGLPGDDPNKIFLPDPTSNGGTRPATSEDFHSIAAFGWHGTPYGFKQLSTSEAADFMANAIVKRSAALKPVEKSIEYVLLSSCDQGTKRWLALWGTTNAKIFSRELNKALAKLGHPPITVLAARDAGIINLFPAVAPPRNCCKAMM